MTHSPAFTAPAVASTFTSSRAAVTSARPPLRVAKAPSKPSVSMQWNPFANKSGSTPSPSDTSYMAPQAGEPGSKPLPKVPKGFGMDKADESAPKKVAQDLPVASDDIDTGRKRGLDLLKEDFLKSAPERAGVGRQDQESLTMKPAAGEPGYKPPTIATVKVSDLGISTFSDDKNYVGNVGGIEALKKAALDVKAGKSAKQIKKEVMDSVNRGQSAPSPTPMASAAPVTTTNSFSAMPTPAPAPTPEDLLPSYLKPLPEDTPRKGMTWKNYEGR